MNTNKKQLNRVIRVSPDTHTEVKTHCDVNGLIMGAWADQQLSNAVKQDRARREDEDSGKQESTADSLS